MKYWTPALQLGGLAAMALIVVGAHLIKHYTDWGWTIWTGGFIAVFAGGLLALVAGVVSKWF